VPSVTALASSVPLRMTSGTYRGSLSQTRAMPARLARLRSSSSGVRVRRAERQQFRNRRRIGGSGAKPDMPRPLYGFLRTSGKHHLRFYEGSLTWMAHESWAEGGSERDQDAPVIHGDTRPQEAHLRAEAFLRHRPRYLMRRPDSSSKRKARARSKLTPAAAPVWLRSSPRSSTIRAAPVRCAVRCA
jgi:hypothetical protein